MCPNLGAVGSLHNDLQKLFVLVDPFCGLSLSLKGRTTFSTDWLVERSRRWERRHFGLAAERVGISRVLPERNRT